MSVTSIQYAGNGNFTVSENGGTKTFNLADLNTMLRMDQVAQYDQQIADQLGEIQKTNQKRKALNALLSLARKSKADRKYSDNRSGSTAGKSDSYNRRWSSGDHSLPGHTEERSIKEWMQYFGISHTTTNTGENFDSAWEANINAIKGEIDNITSDSEMQMLRFRQMVDKRGTALQEAKTTLTNDKRLKDAIVQG